MPTPTPSPTTNGTVADIGDVLINEIQYDSPQTGTDALFEWMELFNCTNETIELEGWIISDNYSSDPIPPLTLLTQGFAVIAASQDFYTSFPNFNGTIAFIGDGHIGNGLSNDGDCLILEDSAETVIDAMSYGDDNSILLPPCLDVAEGHSLERQPAGFDTDQASDFTDNSEPTPGYGLSPSTSSPTPTPTAGPTDTPTTTPTATPGTSPTGSPTPESTTPPSQESPALSGAVLRAILITAALAFFAIVFWFGIRKRRK